MLYKFINENAVRRCPRNGVVDGRAVSNLPRYFELHPEIAQAEGYKELIRDEQPEFDENTQYLTPCYEDGNDNIACHWVINDVEQAEQEDGSDG